MSAAKPAKSSKELCDEIFDDHQTYKHHFVWARNCARKLVSSYPLADPEDLAEKAMWKLRRELLRGNTTPLEKLLPYMVFEICCDEVFRKEKRRRELAPSESFEEHPSLKDHVHQDSFRNAVRSPSDPFLNDPEHI